MSGPFDSHVLALALTSQGTCSGCTGDRKLTGGSSEMDEIISRPEGKIYTTIDSEDREFTAEHRESLDAEDVCGKCQGLLTETSSRPEHPCPLGIARLLPADWPWESHAGSFVVGEQDRCRAELEASPQGRADSHDGYENMPESDTAAPDSKVDGRHEVKHWSCPVGARSPCLPCCASALYIRGRRRRDA